MDNFERSLVVEVDILVVGWDPILELMDTAVDTMALADLAEEDNIPVHFEVVDRTAAEADHIEVAVDSHTELDLDHTWAAEAN